jgi:copper transport protein
MVDVTRRSRRALHAAALATLVSLLVVVPAGLAAAHAALQSSSPRDGAVLAASPDRVLLHFDESVEAALGAVRVFGADGRRADSGQVDHPGGAATDVQVGLRDALPAGTYLVDWRVVSADSHPVHGSFTFSVGRPGALPAVAGSTDSPVPGGLLALSRLVEFAAVLVLTGAVAFLLICWPGGWRQRRATRVVRVALAALAVGTVARLLLQAAFDAGAGPGHLADPRPVRALLSTRLGHAEMARLVLLGAVAVLLARSRGRIGRSSPRIGRSSPRVGRPGPGLGRRAAALGGCLLGVLATVAVAGHAGSRAGAWYAVPLDVVHLAAAGTWLGGLVMLWLAALRVAPPDELAAVLPRYSRLAAGCVGVIVATGAAQAIRQVGEFAALGATGYGRLLIAKIALLAAVLAVAAVSRWLVHRRIAGQPVPAARITGLRRTVRVEATLGVCLVAVTAVLVATPPARTAYHPTTERTVQAGPVTVQLTAIPEGPRRLAIHLYTFDATGLPATLIQLRAQADLPAHSIGPLTLPLLPAGTGHYLAPAAELPMAGRWDLALYVRTSQFDSYTARTSLDVR